MKGAEEEQLEAAMESLRYQYAEVGRREQKLSDLGVLKVSRTVASCSTVTCGRAWRCSASAK